MLRQVYDSSKNASSDQPEFYGTLKAAAFGKLALTSSGRMLEMTSGNGKMAKFDIPTGQIGLTPVAITELFEEFLTRFDDAKQDLGGTPTDEQIFWCMMGYYRSITGYVMNWMYLAK